MKDFADIPDIPDNVDNFVKAVSEIVGNFESLIFESHCKEHFVCHLDNSPIEQILFTALSAVTYIWNTFFGDKIEINPQEKIGEHRVDFLVSYCKDKNEKANNIAYSA